jgi:hypothetical protein
MEIAHFRLKADNFHANPSFSVGPAKLLNAAVILTLEEFRITIIFA